jgi:hypothetical protein
MKNSALVFCSPDPQNALRALHIPPDVKTQVRRNVSWCAFCGLRIGPTQA